MPISLDSSTEEITKALISTYENKLRNMIDTEVNLVHELIRLNKQNCRFIHISILPNIVSHDIVLGCDILFDIKYDVPIIAANTSSSHDSVLIYSRTVADAINIEHRYESINVPDEEGNIHFAECYFLKEDELFKTVINFQYNPDMVKTYKRYIELRGE